MLSNLRAEMVRAGVSVDDMAAKTGKSCRTIRDRLKGKVAIGTSWWMELFSSEITAIFDSVHNSGKGDAVIFWEAILGRQIWLRPPRIWSSKRDS